MIKKIGLILAILIGTATLGIGMYAFLNDENPNYAPADGDIEKADSVARIAHEAFLIGDLERYTQHIIRRLISPSIIEGIATNESFAVIYSGDIKGIRLVNTEKKITKPPGY